MLPNSEVLLADEWNRKLKKLNSLYEVISHCDLTDYPYSVCYMGNDTAVACFSGNTIQYVNVSGKINLRQLMTLDHECFDIACHGDTLYVSSGDTIYKYNKDCTQKQIIFHETSTKLNSPLIAISDNGERLYFKANTGITTIDDKGNHLSSSQFVDYSLRDICIGGEGIVLVLDETNIVHQLDYNGKKHQIVDNMPLNISCPRLMCFDRERCRLIVCGFEGMIYVYKCEFLSS
jgi:hypothetical protein